ncbi:MAG: hypothetical protein MI924_26070 [Chloroflexales bacterium]|nr:hypothetical protein [Chloroflexales bacterium]
MSDLLTHWAVSDDCRRLLPFADGIEPFFVEVLETERTFARLGAITRTEGYWIPPLLQWAREHRDQPALQPAIRRKVACCIAGLTHTACDRLMKPYMQAITYADEASANPTDDNVARLVYAYQDTFVFTQVYLDGHEEPFNRFMMSRLNTAAGQALERWIGTLFQRGVMALRTNIAATDQLERAIVEPLIHDAARKIQQRNDSLRRLIGSLGITQPNLYAWLQELRAQQSAPIDEANRQPAAPAWEQVEHLLTIDDSDPQQRLDSMLPRFLPLYVDFHRLLRAYHQRDPARVQAYRIETDFYNAEDPAIAVARAIQRGEQVHPEEARAATKQGVNQSSYGQALETGIEYIRRSTAFWRGEIANLETPNSVERERLAFCLSALIDATAGALFKPAGLADDAPDATHEAYQYQNAYVFRQTYFDHEAGQFNAFLQADRDTSPEQAMEDLVEALFLRALAANHTLVPDMVALHQWFDNLYTSTNQLSAAIRQQVQILYHPDPVKLEQYEIRTSFYNASDPAVMLARALQRGKPVTTAQVQMALRQRANASTYGRALEQGVSAWKQATKFWLRESDVLLSPLPFSGAQ